jgi:hypothetical protein
VRVVPARLVLEGWRAAPQRCLRQQVHECASGQDQRNGYFSVFHQTEYSQYKREITPVPGQ